jgi:hypothetical protein
MLAELSVFPLDKVRGSLTAKFKPVEEKIGHELKMTHSWKVYGFYALHGQ